LNSLTIGSLGTVISAGLGFVVTDPDEYDDEEDEVDGFDGFDGFDDEDVFDAGLFLTVTLNLYVFLPDLIVIVA
jgi:hypothetical protein